MEVTPEEARRIVSSRASSLMDEYFQLGLEAAATEIMAWDGAIEDESMRRSIAQAIRRLKRSRKTKQKES
jgi:hypothetical protein